MKTRLKNVFLVLVGIILMVVLLPLFIIELLVIMPSVYIITGNYYFDNHYPINMRFLVNVLYKIL